MDAWLVRRTPAVAASTVSPSSSAPPLSAQTDLPPLPPSRQLVVSDRALLLAVADEDAVLVERALAAVGARILSSSDALAEQGVHADVTLLVVGTAAARTDVDAATRQHPRAVVVNPAWVQGTKKADSGSSAADDAPEPVRKKPRVAEAAAKLPVNVVVNGDGDAATPTVDGDVAIATPTLTRAWETVHDGALYFLDTRPQLDVVSRPLKLAAFDLDGTLITTKSGKRFAQHADDWKLLDATRVPSTLKRLAREGFTLVILSNQNGVAKGKTSAREVQTKLLAVVRRLNVPMLVLFATHDDDMRKPRIGAWRWLRRRLGVDDDDDEKVDEASFYCGDAAGRPKQPGRNKDFAATDYEFALNADLQFVTPEALFLQSTQRIHTRPEMWEIGFDARALPVGGDRLDPKDTELARPATQEIVVLVGPPASGKSHFAAQFTDYHVVCQDELKTVAKCVAACGQALQAGKSVVVDCTNREPRSRKDWVGLAQKHGVAVRCFFMDVAKPLSMHLNTFRKLTSSKDIPDIAIHTFYKNYIPPQKEEGFEAIVKVRFCVDPAALSPAQRKLITSFL